VIYLVHADGALPNLALMRLATWFRNRGTDVRLLRRPEDYAPLLDPRPSAVYGSSIFRFTAERRARFEAALGPITWGGTGVRVESSLAEIADVDWDSVEPDYSLYPACLSLGERHLSLRLWCWQRRDLHLLARRWRGDRHDDHCGVSATERGERR
jgi:hypothetical protein